jgi:hypothetical protein
MNTELLKLRVKGRVRFLYFTDQALWYETIDSWAFPVPVSDTGNEQGSAPVFMAEDKGVIFMRWIRKHMEAQSDPR